MKHTAGKSEQSLELTGLVPGSVYNFKVNSAGFSASDTCQVTLPPSQPGRPKVTGKTLSTSACLTWAKPTHGAASVQHDTVLYQSKDKWFHQVTHGAKELINVSNLLPGTTYKFKVRAEGTDCSSPDSELIEVMLPPSQPSKPQASTVYYNKILLKWSPPIHGAQIVSSYLISYHPISSKKWQTQISQDSDSASIPGLTPMTKYVFKVRAEAADDVGSSPDSELSDPIETLLPPPYATEKTQNSIQLSWKKPAGFESVMGYTISSRCEHDPSDRWTLLKTNKPIEHIDYNNLCPGSVYTFKVRTETSTGPGQESDVAIVTLPPGQPGKPLVLNNSCDSVEIACKMPAEHGSSGIQRYSVLYCSMADSDGKWHVCSTNGTEGFIKISNLIPGTVYSFKVRAEGAEGNSPESESVEVTLPPDQPGRPEASAVFHDRIKLKWSPPKHGALTVNSYLIYYKPQVAYSKSKNWQLHASENVNATICGLTPTTTYVFKVKAETDVGSSPDSEISDPITTSLPPPGKPYSASLSYENFLVRWKKPSTSAHNIIRYSLFYRSDDESIDEWNVLLTSDDENSYNFGADSGKMYVFKVSAVTLIGNTAESEISDPIETRPRPWGQRYLSRCKKIHSESPIYQLPLRVTMKTKNIVKAVVGEIDSRKYFSTVAPHKVLMLVGATGAGKTTLINGMVNYIMGVKWEDEYRFKLISEEETAHDQSKSQIKCITAYTFHKDRGSPLPYTLTVIDTPGFGDTRGLERDKEIVAQIKEFFSIRGDQGIDQLHGIGFVTQAPLARLTPTQRYVFDSILSVFGKDVADNIFLMVTFADVARPPVLDAAKAAGVPFSNHFKFNNSALFNQNINEFDEIFWKIGQISYEGFFCHFSRSTSISLILQLRYVQQNEQKHMEVRRLQEIALKPGHLTELEYFDTLIESEKQESRPGWRERVSALEEVRRQAVILSRLHM